MTKFAISALALLVAGAISPAMSADVYDAAGGLKDGGPAIAAKGRGGVYLSGFVGYSWGDRDIRAKTNREVGLYAEMEPPVEPVEGDYETTEAYEAARAQYAEDKAKYDECLEEMLLAAGPDAGVDGATLSVPLLGDLLSNAGGGDVDGFVYGAELSRLWHNGGALGFEAALGVTAYSNGDSGIAWTGAHGVLTHPSAYAGEPVAPLDPSGALGQTGFASVDRQFDIDLVGRLYGFVNPRLALFAGGGVSIAKAQICAASSTDGVALLEGGPLHSFAAGAFNHSGCDDDWSIGPVGQVGFRWWASDRLAITGMVDVKSHEFEGKAGGSAKIGEALDGNCCNISEVGIDGKSDTRIEVEDVLWAAKVGVSYNLSGGLAPLE